MNDYNYWYSALAGYNPPVNQNEPMSGFYRMKSGAPVAIWYEEGEAMIMVGDKMVQPDDHEETWTRCCMRPVTEEQYKTVTEGGVWHDMDTTVAETLGDNIRDADDAEAIAELIKTLAAAAEAYDQIEDDETAAKAQSLRSRALEVKGKADKVREAHKKPHLEAGKMVDKLWMPMVKSADDIVIRLRKAMEKWETTKLVERRKKEAEEAAARAAAAPKELDMSGPDQPEPEPAEKRGIRGGYGRAASVGTKKVVTGISDRQALFDHLWPDPELMALMNRMAQRQVDAGLTVPGVTIEEQAVVR
jgi:hypothetical protein